MIRRVLLAGAALLVLLVVALGVNTLTTGSRQLQVPAVAGPKVDEQAVGDSLSRAIRARTVSSATDAAQNVDQFEALQAHLRQRYPRVHAQLKREVIGGLSLLYTWSGTDASAPAIALMAHQDVVPIAPGTEGDWLAEPFAGAIKDGYVWGRGAWDDKSNLITQLEAVETLLGEDFVPRRTVYLVFGADEEVGGERGALQISRLLQQRGVKLEYVIDEGLLLTQGILKGLKAPAALVGVAEKGYVSVRMQAKAQPGHSSLPPAVPGQQAIAQISRALVALDNRPMPASIGGVAGDMFDVLAPEMDGLQRVVLSNRWLFGPLLVRQLEQAGSTNALLRTTTALTIVNAGNKDNVLPGRAEAVVNFRLAPGDSRQTVVEHVRRTIANEAIEVAPLPGGGEPSAVADTAAPSYQAVNRTVREVFPGALVAPGLMLAGTDSRHFEPFTRQIYRFSPVRAGPEDLSRFHGTNERISLANLAEMVRFYHRLLQHTAGAPGASR